jgi:hypothetical protein
MVFDQDNAYLNSHVAHILLNGVGINIYARAQTNMYVYIFMSESFLYEILIVQK